MGCKRKDNKLCRFPSEMAKRTKIGDDITDTDNSINNTVREEEVSTQKIIVYMTLDKPCTAVSSL